MSPVVSNALNYTIVNKENNINYLFLFLQLEQRLLKTAKEKMEQLSRALKESKL